MYDYEQHNPYPEQTTSDAEDILTPQTLYDLRYPQHLEQDDDDPQQSFDQSFVNSSETTPSDGDNYTYSYSTAAEANKNFVPVSFAKLSSEAQLEQLERFKGICALYGYAGFAALQKSHVVILGNGGVGSWIAESMCRTGVGNITLVDFDSIELSNSNRQLHTLKSTLRQGKAATLGQRLRDINPYLNLRIFDCQLTKDIINEQFAAILQLSPEEVQLRQEPNLNKIENPNKIAQMMRQSEHPIFVAEAIDDLPAKTRCVDILHRLRIPLVSSGGAGGRIDPQHLKISDVAQAQGDQLIKHLRTELRREFGYPRGQGNQPFNICCTCSDENPKHSQPLTSDDRLALQALGLDPSLHNSLPSLPKFGASMSVTASSGLLISSVLIRWICGL